MRNNPPTNLQPGLVSIGVPVYNGARYLREALESLLTQDYPHFEIIISDNASDDETEAICREFAARDQRVRYYRTEENKGPFWNFVNVYELARGEFFMWNSHDDRRDPRCVSLCVEAFREHPEAVMCCMGTRLVDEEGQELENHPRYQICHPVGRTRQERLRQIARTKIGTDFYSLFRTQVIASTRFGRIMVWGGDTVIIAEVSMLGEVVAVPEVLFQYRQGRKKTAGQIAEVLSGWGTQIFPSWIGLVAELMESVRLAPINRFEKLRLQCVIATEMCVRDPGWSPMMIAEGFQGLCRALHQGQYRRALRIAMLGSLCRAKTFYDRLKTFYNRLRTSFRYRCAQTMRVISSAVKGPVQK